MSNFLWEDEATLTDFLIALLCMGKSWMHFHHIMQQRVVARRKRSTVSTTLNRLRERGYIERGPMGWKATNDGEKYFHERQLSFYLPSPFSSRDPQSLIISFDIPEPDRKIRNWLREQLKLFGYKMIQQSLWIGPGPLPQEFDKRVTELGIQKNIRKFKLSRPRAK